MTIYTPAESTVADHLSYLGETAHLPTWKRGEGSLELLLGLRDPMIDSQLRKIAPMLPGEVVSQFDLSPDVVLAALDDPSVSRIVSLVVRRASALPLAWARIGQNEIPRLLDEMSSTLLEGDRIHGVSTAILASLSEISRAGGHELPSSLVEAATTRWVDQAAIQLSSKQARPGDFQLRLGGDGWCPLAPQALLRDPLTGLLNRSVLTDDPHRFRLPGGSTLTRLPTDGVVLVDVDHMKKTLDYYGMLAGDHVLRAIADCFQRQFGDNVIRFGGDEMLIACDASSVAEVAAKAVEGARTIRVPVPDAPSEEIKVSVSAGAVHGSELQDALRAADDALAAAKRAGRDQFRVG